MRLQEMIQMAFEVPQAEGAYRTNDRVVLMQWGFSSDLNFKYTQTLMSDHYLLVRSGR